MKSVLHYISICLILLVLNSCKVNDQGKLLMYRSPNEFDYYGFLFFLDSFYYTKSNFKDLKIIVLFERTKHSPESKNVGECYAKAKKIHLEKKYWNDSNFYKRKILYYHEYGHCLFEQDHRNFSIMQAVLLDDELYRQHEYHFIHEFFNYLN